MSRDVVTVGLNDSAERARELLLAHNIRTLPVVDGAGRLAGTLGLRELSLRGEGALCGRCRRPGTAAPMRRWSG
ncbi:CBS domain-containing protein [Methylobacterium oryzae CBMB20]